MADVIGWISSLLLLTTLTVQIRKQWKERTSKGVSRWLFIGQVFSGIGFVIYSLLVNNWVFAVTNSLLTIQNIVALFITLHFKKLAAR